MRSTAVKAFAPSVIPRAETGAKAQAKPTRGVVRYARWVVQGTRMVRAAVRDEIVRATMDTIRVGDLMRGGRDTRRLAGRREGSR